MRYRINEASLTIPSYLIDRSINMLMSPDGFSVSYVMARDMLLKGEDLSRFIERQLKELSRQVGNFTQVSKQEAIFGQNKNKRVGVQIQSTFRQEGKDIFQRQAILLLDDNIKVLVITATAGRKFLAEEETDWLEMLKSYEPL